MSLDDYSDYKIAKGIQAAYPPILILVGLTGNIISIIVLAQRKHRKTSTGLLLICLAVTDSVILICVLLVDWLSYLFELSFSSVSCKLRNFITYFLLHLSPWILVIVTVERTCCVLYPQRVRRIFTRRRVLILTVVCIIFFVGLNSHLLYGSELVFDEIANKTSCQITDKHMDFVFKIWPWIDFAFAFAIPFCVLLCGNIIVLKKIKSSHHFRKRSVLKSKYENRSNGSVFSRSGIRRTPYFTTIAVILNITFIVFVSPFTIFAIGQPYWFPLDTKTPKRYAKLLLIGTLMQMLMYTNNAINFILYILCGSKVRKDIVKLLCCKRRRLRAFSDSLSSNTTTKSSFSGSRSSHSSATSQKSDAL
ncbi:gastrin-releasing peptide receptor-like [Mercenaria mercenaria]|uniref:gastrin-releasing peptide receptor-like n=1 Tax=Mercenaria mercenaria TaxID=6596 RepID=UPI00234FAD37|nr:gastrin-releasing peptide receptor-like [Mercenaria mercenaria]